MPEFIPIRSTHQVSPAEPQPAKAAAADRDIPIGDAKTRAENAVQSATKSDLAASLSETRIATSATNIHAAKGVNIDPFLDILTPELKPTVAIDMSTLGKAVTSTQADAKEARKLPKESRKT